MNNNSGGSGIDRKNYNKLTAQIAKGAIKKKITGIIRGGAQATDGLIDDLLKSNEKDTSNGIRGGGQRSGNASYLAPIAKRVIERNRVKWRNFLIEVATRFDPDAISNFGVNFIYGGLMTLSVGNVGWASVIETDGERQVSAAATLETVSRGKLRGNMVWIIKGRGLFSPEMIKIYRFNPECAFILHLDASKDGEMWTDAEAPEISRWKNLLIIVPEAHQKTLADIRKRGWLYAVLSQSKKAEQERGNGHVSGIPAGLWNFLESPSLPLRADGMEELFDDIENLLSDKKSRRMPRYVL